MYSVKISKEGNTYTFRSLDIQVDIRGETRHRPIPSEWGPVSACSSAPCGHQHAFSSLFGIVSDLLHRRPMRTLRLSFLAVFAAGKAHGISNYYTFGTVTVFGSDEFVDITFGALLPKMGSVQNRQLQLRNGATQHTTYVVP